MTNKKKQMSWIWQPWPSSLHRKIDNMLTKVTVCLLLIGISYRLLFYPAGSSVKQLVSTNEINRNSTDKGENFFILFYFFSEIFIIIGIGIWGCVCSHCSLVVFKQNSLFSQIPMNFFRAEGLQCKNP